MGKIRVIVHRKLDEVRGAVEWSPLSPDLIPHTSSRIPPRHERRHIKQKKKERIVRLDPWLFITFS